jgi:hypothetical protein
MRINRHLVRALLSACLLVVCYFATSERASAQGPVILMGIDAEDGWPSHGSPDIYAGIINTGILSNIAPPLDLGIRSGILVIGAGKSATDNVTTFWQQIQAELVTLGRPAASVAMTFVNGAAAIASVPIPPTQYAAIVIVSDVVNTPSGGLTQAELDALNARAADIAAHINSGGGLFALSNCALSNPYQYLSGVAPITCGIVFQSDVEPTPAGLALGITSTNLDVCCWHDSYLSFPPFLSVLAYYPRVTGQPAAAIGGNQVSLPGLKLAPLFATNPVGTSHTVTATVTQLVGGTEVPVPGVTVNFTVSGANTASGSCVTDANGQCTFTYVGTATGFDTITATAVVAGQTLTAAATKEWTAAPPPQPGWMTGGGSVFTTTGQRVTHGFVLQCDPAQGSNNLQVNWGDQRFHLESVTSVSCSDDPSIDPGQPPAPFDTIQGTGVGRYKQGNGPWQSAIVEWIFTDAGEPGRGVDRVRIKITLVSSGAVVLDVDGFLNSGNHQAHVLGDS